MYLRTRVNVDMALDAAGKSLLGNIIQKILMKERERESRKEKDGILRVQAFRSGAK